MGSKAYWFETGGMPTFPKLEQDLQVDVAVVGGGFTGITTALLLKRSGLRVALLEQDAFASKDTGHTTSHLTYVTDKRLHALTKDFGRDEARLAWQAGRTAVRQIEAIIEHEQLEAGFRWVSGFLHVPWDAEPEDPRAVKELHQEAELARQLSFDATFISQVPIADRPGVRFADQAKFNPQRYLAGLLARIAGDGSHVLEHSRVEHFLEEGNALVANGRTVRYQHVVLATHVPLMGEASMLRAATFQTKLSSQSSYVVGARLPPDAAPEVLLWDTSEPYYYLRLDQRDDHLIAIFGGNDHKTGTDMSPQPRYEDLERRLKAMFPQAQPRYRWSGQIIATHDGLPFIGELTPHQFIATGYAGNGITFGTVAAMMATDYVLGRENPWSDLFAPNRTKIRGGALRYLRENLDYPYYLIKDRLTLAESRAVDTVAPGEGAVLKMNGQRVAVYRDHEGQVTYLSPICTHMGCLVRWNQTESTWDCPCHGSRFHAKGTVHAGPAETPLPQVHPEPNPSQSN